MFFEKMYHGTNCSFRTFDAARLGAGNDEAGSGFYLTTNKETASQYAFMRSEEEGKPTILEAAVTVKKPIILKQGMAYGDVTCTMTGPQIKKVLTAYPGILEQSDENPLGDYMEEYWDVGPSKELVYKMADQYFRPQEFSWLQLESFFSNHLDAYHKAVTAACGIDSVVVELKDGGTTVVAWHPDQVVIRREFTPMTEEDKEKEASAWLSELQADLLADREAETVQASPIYYGIIEKHKRVVSEGFADETVFIDGNSGEEIDLFSYLDELSQEELEELVGETGPEYLSVAEDGTYTVGDADTLIELIVDEHPDRFEYRYLAEEDMLASDALFLTRKDADAYLQQYGYNHHAARSYAMTAVRSPRYEKLLDLLKNIDWDASTLKFR